MRLGRRSFSVLGLLSALPLHARSAATPATGDLAVTLHAAAFDLFPHGAVSTDVYADAAESFLAARGAPANELVQGLGGRAFVDLAEADRILRLQNLEHTAAFQAFRFHVLTRLYANPEVTRSFGYEGPSLEAGGYLRRGFDDIRWLSGREPRED